MLKDTAMVIPPWFTLLVAGTVIAFGLYRLRLAFRSDGQDESARQRKGVFGLPRRTQAIRGFLYLLMGGILLADLLGVVTNPFRLLAPEEKPEREPEPKLEDAVQVTPRPDPAPTPAPASETPPSS